ncbi:uncharacterized protein LOC110855677 [Folsomia candida]|uniref:uncharacterized protein LOC110855677 n=1 Tax=Folsomia candida TaxID=158441 RepID=UPI000B8FFC26|nr:uncharacterized protein LOC110855677 [Folsomia candida]
MEQGNDSVAKDLQIVMGLMAKNKIELPSTVVLKGEKIQPVDHTSLPDMLVGGGKEGGNPTPSTSTSSSNQADEKMETEEERIAKEFGKEDAAAKVYHCAVCHLEVSGEEVRRCGKCRRRVYCGKECQLVDWSCKVRGKGQGHKNWCGIPYGEEDEDWCVAHVPGKGLGIVAMRSFSAKERILVVEHRPIAEIFSGSGLTKSDTVGSLGRLKMINHACDCNASRFPVEDGAMSVVVLHAHRDIAAGEEITVSYSAFNETSFTASSESAQESRAYLQSTYNIICREDCFCRDENLDQLIDEGKGIDRSLKIPQPEIRSKKSVNTKLRQIEALLSIQTQVKASFLARLSILKLGFCLAVMQSATLPLAMQYLTEAKELLVCISHPKTKAVQEFDQLLEDVSTYPEYLKFD